MPFCSQTQLCMEMAVLLLSTCLYMVAQRCFFLLFVYAFIPISLTVVKCHCFICKPSVPSDVKCLALSGVPRVVIHAVISSVVDLLAVVLPVLGAPDSCNQQQDPSFKKCQDGACFRYMYAAGRLDRGPWIMPHLHR